MERLELLGPRKGETHIAFRKRMAALREGRRLWIEAWTTTGGDLAACAAALGLAPSGTSHALRQDGLSITVLTRLTGIYAAGSKE